MTDSDRTEHINRLTTIEIKLMDLEQSLTELNDVIVRQSRHVDQLQHELQRLALRLQNREDDGLDATAEPPPPHY